MTDSQVADIMALIDIQFWVLVLIFIAFLIFDRVTAYFMGVRDSDCLCDCCGAGQSPESDSVETHKSKGTEK